MSYLRYLCLLTYIGVQHIVCCALYCFRLVHPMLLVSLDCSFLIAPSVFSIFYLYVRIFFRLFMYPSAFVNGAQFVLNIIKYA
jgi:hypothetical protein